MSQKRNQRMMQEVEEEKEKERGKIKIRVKPLSLDSFEVL